MAQVTEKSPAQLFEPGMDVVLHVGNRDLTGRVVENRGFIGLGGTQIVRIQVFPQDVEEPVIFEVPVTALSLN